MASPLFKDEVLVTLTAVNPPTNFTFPTRKVFLSPMRRNASIGRASKRSKDLEPSPSNGWFDVPVMSRNHAELTLDAKTQKVYIEDVGSLHGTFQNGRELVKKSARELFNYDVLAFGVPIERGNAQFPQCTMRVALQRGNAERTQQPAIFRVPDESDVEFIATDDEADVIESVRIIRDLNVHPAPMTEVPSSDLVDLTFNDADSVVSVDLEISTPNSTPPVLSPAKVEMDRTAESKSIVEPASTVTGITIHTEPASDSELQQALDNVLAIGQGECQDGHHDEHQQVQVIVDGDNYAPVTEFTKCFAPATSSRYSPSVVLGVENNTASEPIANLEADTVFAKQGSVPFGTDEDDGAESAPLQALGDHEIAQNSEKADEANAAAELAESHTAKPSKPACISTGEQAAGLRKRKADQMEQSEDSTSSSAAQPVVHSPRNKLRRVVECLGCVAFGGALAVTALVASAPDLV